ncbi:MAG TPA: NAD(P)H-dependent oxidoreductase [Solirubrobacteraceae bacterium]|nr:NAD(P)H-dependent oxidoreductase [Solirubrobacteraceae bacterium]
MLKIGIVTGSTRPGRANLAVAQWVLGIAQQREDAEFELVDIAEYQLPLFDEPMSPMFGRHTKRHAIAWADTIAAFVSYGGAGGVRAVEHLRLILAELMVATVRAQVTLSLVTDFQHFTTFTPDPRHAREIHTMLDQLVAWGETLKPLRTREQNVASAMAVPSDGGRVR